MEKISSILSSNKRVTNTDLEYSHPVRPGVPTFGRRVGSTSAEREQIRNRLAEEAAEARRAAMDSAVESSEGEAIQDRVSFSQERPPMDAKVPSQDFNSVAGVNSKESVKETVKETGREARMRELKEREALGNSFDKYA